MKILFISLSIILAIVGIVLIKKHKDLSIVSFLFSIAVFFVSLFSSGIEYEIQRFIVNNGSFIEGEASNLVVFNQYITNSNNTDDESVSLSSAQMKLELKHYEEAAQIYLTLLELEPNNSTALCNLGYIYEHGLETPIDLEKAREYYSKAIENGNEQALHNLLALELMSDKSLDMFDSIIWYGIEQEDGNICRFIAASIYQNENILEDVAIKVCQDIETIDSDSFWTWEDTGKVASYNGVTNSNIIRYLPITEGTEKTDDGIRYYTVYRKEERTCPYVYLLEAGFDKANCR